MQEVQGHRNKQGVVETITALRKEGLKLVLSNMTQGTAKICDSLLNLFTFLA